MKRKRLNRDLKWGFQNYPYYQAELSCGRFSGFASLIFPTDGEALFRPLEKAGRVQVAGEGMIWLQLVPRDGQRLVTVMFRPGDTAGDFRVSAWYLDVIASPQGDLIVDDRDELDEAFRSHDLTREQYDEALLEANRIVSELFRDMRKTEEEWIGILNEALRAIGEGRYTLALNEERA